MSVRIEEDGLAHCETTDLNPGNYDKCPNFNHETGGCKDPNGKLKCAGYDLIQLKIARLQMEKGQFPIRNRYHAENMEETWEHENAAGAARQTARSAYLRTHPVNFLEYNEWLKELYREHPELRPQVNTE